MIKRKVFGVFEWLGGHEFMVLLAVLTVVAGTWGFIALADVVRKGRTQSLRRVAAPCLASAGCPGETDRSRLDGRSRARRDCARRRRRAGLGDPGGGRLSLLGPQVRRYGLRVAAVTSGLLLSSLLKAVCASAASGCAAPFPGLYQQLPQRTLDDVGHRLSDPGGPAGADGRPASAQGLCPGSGLDPDRGGRLQPRLHGRALPYRRPGGLDRRARCGPLSAGSWPADCNAAARSRNACEDCIPRPLRLCWIPNPPSLERIRPCLVASSPPQFSSWP